MINTKKKRRIGKTRKKTNLYIGHQCYYTRNWMSNHLKYIVIQPREKVAQSQRDFVVYCLMCQDKKKHDIHDIMYHFMSNHYNQFIETSNNYKEHNYKEHNYKEHNYDCK